MLIGLNVEIYRIFALNAPLLCRLCDRHVFHGYSPCRKIAKAALRKAQDCWIARLVIGPVAVVYCTYYIPSYEQSQTNRIFLYMKFAPERDFPVQVQIVDIAIAGVLGGYPLNKRILLSKCYACGNTFRIAFAIRNVFLPMAEAPAPFW